MNRSDLLRLIAVADAVAGEARKMLKAEAAAEWAEHKTTPTWNGDGVKAVGSRTHDRVEISDQDEFMAWLVKHEPHLVMTVVVPRNPQAIKDYLAAKAAEGPLLDAGKPLPEPGRSAPVKGDVPGLLWVRGGEFHALSVTVDGTAKRALAKLAREALDGGAMPRELDAVFEGRAE